MEYENIKRVGVLNTVHMIGFEEKIREVSIGKCQVIKLNTRGKYGIIYGTNLIRMWKKGFGSKVELLTLIWHKKVNFSSYTR